MPQYPLAPVPWGTSNARNINAATVVKAAPGAVLMVSVTTAGSASGAVYDAATTGGNTAANLIATIPNTVGVISLHFPCMTGILIVPPTGGVVSVAYA